MVFSISMPAAFTSSMSSLPYCACERRHQIPAGVFVADVETGKIPRCSGNSASPWSISAATTVAPSRANRAHIASADSAAAAGDDGDLVCQRLTHAQTTAFLYASSTSPWKWCTPCSLMPDPFGIIDDSSLLECRSVHAPRHTFHQVEVLALQYVTHEGDRLQLLLGGLARLEVKIVRFRASLRG